MVTQCSRGERKSLRLAAAAAQEVSRTECSAQQHVIEWVETFKYLVQILSSEDIDWPVVAGNLWKLRWKLGRFSSILVREG